MCVASLCWVLSGSKSWLKWRKGSHSEAKGQAYCALAGESIVQALEFKQRGQGEQIASSPVSVDPARPHPAPEVPTTTIRRIPGMVWACTLKLVFHLDC